MTDIREVMTKEKLIDKMSDYIVEKVKKGEVKKDVCALSNYIDAYKPKQGIGEREYEDFKLRVIKAVLGKCEARNIN